MAIDTEDKRMSMLSLHTSRIVPQPDGAIDQNDRQTLLGRYGGLLWTSLTASKGAIQYTNIWRFIEDG